MILGFPSRLVGKIEREIDDEATIESWRQASGLGGKPARVPLAVLNY
jgi:hypothetical protein